MLHGADNSAISIAAYTSFLNFEDDGCDTQYTLQWRVSGTTVTVTVRVDESNRRASTDDNCFAAATCSWPCSSAPPEWPPDGAVLARVGWVAAAATGACGRIDALRCRRSLLFFRRRAIDYATAAADVPASALPADGCRPDAPT
uniref:Cadherin domain-containing protein n=1 Tax=Angiostrongylus cantonensis TaxID=6313 RepID=A0A0K0CUG6_ANGCA